MTEAEAEKTIRANGYVIRKRGAHIDATEPSRSSSTKTWTGVNFLDLAQTFGLHERKANKARGRAA